MAVLDDAVSQQLSQFPGGPVLSPQAGPASTPYSGGEYSGATISRPPFLQTPEWLNTATQIAMMPHQALLGVTQPLYRTMFSGTPFDVNTVATQHPWIAQHLPAFAGLDPQTGQPAWGTQFMQQRVADPLSRVATMLMETELPIRLMGGASKVPTTTDRAYQMENLIKKFLIAQNIGRQRQPAAAAAGQ